jgi:biopolymer transport protein ExbB
MLSFALLGAEWVLWVLVAMSVACIAVAVERVWFLQRETSDAQQLGDAVNAYLGDGDRDRFSTQLKAIDGAEARILKAGLEVADMGPDAAEKAMSGTATAERLKMERGLLLLATTGSNAPFIGLFGTVLGIMQAFHDLSLETDEAEAAVMAGISEALVATAVGLLVAIPAVVLYNSLSRTVRTRLGASESLADLVLARVTGEAHSHGG